MYIYHLYLDIHYVVHDCVQPRPCVKDYACAQPRWRASVSSPRYVSPPWHHHLEKWYLSLKLQNGIYT